MSPLEIVVLVLAIVGGSLGVTFVWLRRVAARRAEAMRERFPAARVIVPGANFFGQESRGAAQLRGNGTLVVTDAELYFERWLPRAEYRIPITAIQAVETPRGFLGKTVGRPLLKVVYRDDSGQIDAMAWYVPDVAGLKQLLDSRRA